MALAQVLYATVEVLPCLIAFKLAFGCISIDHIASRMWRQIPFAERKQVSSR